tara:strand:- start:7480 stop:11349 length:3870 start_codon:yes stop_codon:yes gene_type:complete
LLSFNIKQFVIVSAVVSLIGTTVWAQENMIGRQSQNEGLSILPVPNKVPGGIVIDGKLDDWDWSGRIEIFADVALRGRYSVQLAGMWDQDYLYLAAKWSDPTPMFSMVDPQFDPDRGWLADAWQMRFKTDRKMHMTAWYYAKQNQPCLSLSYKDDGGNPHALKHKDGYFESGINLAFAKDADSKGYVEELRIPWRFLYQQLPQIKAGLTFRFGNEFLWGDTSGKTWPIHRYADNMQPGVTSREFYWSADKAWGNATLIDRNNIQPRRYIAKDSQPKGSIPVRATVPKDASRFTIVIEDAHGKRVRNLVGDFQVQDYSVAQQNDAVTVEVRWDGNDDQGKLVTPGEYRVRGLTHKGIGAEYELCYYNPGTPPWGTADGSGSWGADHGPPLCVATAGDWIILSWEAAEGGSGIIGIAPDGLKKWGEKRGASLLAANSEYVYGIMAYGNEPQKLCRYAVKDGAYRPYEINGKTQPIELPVRSILQQPNTKIVAISANKSTLVLATDAAQLLVLNAHTLKQIAQYQVGAVSAIALGDENQCAVNVDGRIAQIDLDNGNIKTLRTPGVEKAGRLTWDHDGNVLVFDEGKDLQIKAFSVEGKLVYTCGKTGGRPLRGVYDKQGLLSIVSMDVDAKGHVWTVEQGENPRRVATWGRDGKLVRDMVGNTGYSGTGSYLDANDPDSAFIGSLRFSINRKQRTSELAEILWVPRSEHSETFTLWSHPHHFSNPGFVQSKSSGKQKTYLYHNGQYSSYHAIHMKRKGVWQPVSAVCYAKDLKKMLPDLPLPQSGNKSVVIWNDTNRDAAVQYEECQLLDQPVNLSASWTHTIGSDLSFFTEGMYRFVPVDFTDDGAPVYGPAGIKHLNQKIGSTFVPVLEDNLLLVVGSNLHLSNLQIAGLELDTAKIKWTYPNAYPGVHGSHEAPMPRAGMIIGPLKPCGIAEINQQVGKVMMMRGNLGQDFYMTADGLFVGAMFRDVRLPGEALPQTEEELLGRPVDVLTMGSEPFNGWFGKQSDGVTRMLCGLAGQSAMLCRITGLDTIQRFDADALSLDALQLADADQFNKQQSDNQTNEKIYTIKQVSTNPMTDHNAWQTLPVMQIQREGSSEKAEVKLAYDAQNLYVQFQVQDTSPWKNAGKDYTRLFKTGDCVELYLSANEQSQHTDPVVGDQRIVIAPYQDQPVAVLMQVQPFGPIKGQSVTYRTNWSRTLGNVALLNDARVKVSKQNASYTVWASIPIANLGLDTLQGKTLRGDVGFISSDAQGMINVARCCWSNKATNLVSDEPLEAWLYPANWGTLRFE